MPLSVTTLQNQLLTCQQNSGTIPQTTINTINETNSIVKAIKITVDAIKDFINRLVTSAGRGI